MSIDEDLLRIARTAVFLQDHCSEDINTAALSLSYILSLARSSHHRGYGRIKDVGYAPFSRDREKVFEQIVKDLRRLLKSVNPRFRNNEALRTKVLSSITFTKHELDGIMAAIRQLRSLVMAERLPVYVPWVLRKIRRSSRWIHSSFKMKSWADLDSILSDDNKNGDVYMHLNQLISTISSQLGIEADIVKMWIRFGAHLAPKDLYIAHAIQDVHTDKVARRVFSDDAHLEQLTGAGDLESKAYRLAFTTFRDDWFETVEQYRYIVTPKISAWMRARVDYKV